MPKPTTYATPICLGLTILAAIGLIIGWVNHSVILILLFALPAVVYEIYRTEGESTRWASWGLLAVIILEIFFIWRNVSFDLASYFNSTEQYIDGYLVPLGDIKVIGPLIIAVLAVILFFRTYGKYTKWLAVIIFISALAAVFILKPDIFKTLLPAMIQQGLYRL